MKILWFFALLHAALAQKTFGTSYMGNPVLCRQWSCLNTKLGLTDALPDKNQFQAVLNSLLPERAWQNVATKVVDTCYNNRPRVYTSTCPGQALLSCAVDQLIQNCLKDNLRKDDACTPVTSPPGSKILFSQSRYKDMEKNLRTDMRPEWFLKYYFSSKCCNLPDLFKTSVLNKCGLTSLITYYDYPPLPAYQAVNTTTPSSKTVNHENKVAKSQLQNLVAAKTSTAILQSALQVPFKETDYKSIDFLDCCDMDEFIQPTWRSECDFRLNWSIPTRLVIKESTKPANKTSQTVNDVKVVPLSCEKETCIFTKLGVISASGAVDMDALSRLLDNMTDFYPDWSQAKVRAVSMCLDQPIREYTEECEINKLLACIMDVLSMFCPQPEKKNSCKASKVLQDGSTCQINALLIPKNRRLFCAIPNLVNHKVLSECGVTSISRMEYVSVPVAPKEKRPFYMDETCRKSEPAKCVVGKMGVINKHGQLDYFKMRDRIGNFTSQDVWVGWSHVYQSALSSPLMYNGLCHTSNNLLNVVDFMLSTCPISKRRNTQQCSKIFAEMDKTAPFTTIDKKQVAKIWTRFQRLQSSRTG